MKHKKIILFFFSIAFLGYFWGVFKTHQTATAADPATYSSNGINFTITNYRGINNYDDFIVEQLPNVFVMIGNQITLPYDIGSTLSNRPVNDSNADGWTDIRNLYLATYNYYYGKPLSQDPGVALADDIAEKSAHESLDKIDSALKAFLYSGSKGSITIAPTSITTGSNQSVSVKARYGGNKDTSPIVNLCAYYYGDSTGFHWIANQTMQADGSCGVFTWTPASNLSTGQHSVVVAFVNKDSFNATSDHIYDHVPSLNVSSILTVCDESDNCEATNSLANSITVTPTTLTTQPTQSAKITGFFADYVSQPDTACYLYIGDGQGTYSFKDYAGVKSDGTCGTFTWTTSADTFIGPHTVAITFQPMGWANPTKIARPDSPPYPRVSSLVNVCASGTCKDLSNVESAATVQPNAVTLQSNDPKPKFSVWIKNPLEADSLADSQYYFYIGDGQGGWIRRGSCIIAGGSANQSNPPVPNCTWQWDYSGTPPGNHGFVYTLTDAGQIVRGSVPGASNKITITVCAAGTAGCTASGNTFDNGDGSGGSSGTFDATIDPNKIASGILDADGNPFHLSDDLKTAEGIYHLILNLASDFIGVLAFIAIIVGGIMIMSSGGDPAKAAKGKKSIIYGIVGIIVAVLSYAIIAYIIGQLNSQ